MAEVLLTFYCAGTDGPVIAEGLRTATKRPAHLRDETVFGLDFSDASTAERVTGRLERAAIEIEVPEEDVEALVARVGALRRAAPVRWRVSAIVAGGRLS